MVVFCVQLPSICTQDLVAKVPNVVCATNPCRLRHYTQDIVVFRQDLQQKMHRQALVPAMDDPSDRSAAGDMSKHVRIVTTTESNTN